MRRLFFTSKKGLTIAAIFILLAVGVRAQNILQQPYPPRLVVDAAGMLGSDEANDLEQKLVAFDDSTSNQIAVVTIDSLGDNDLEDYANQLFRKWGIGTKKNDNGVLLLIVKDTRQIRIEVGYGLEGAITDEQSGSIIRDILTPNFKTGDYYTGIDQAVTALEQAAAGEYKIPRQQSDDLSTGDIIIGMIFGGLFFLLLVILGGNSGDSSNGGEYSSSGYSSDSGSSSSFGGFGGGSSGGGGASGGW